MSRSPVCILKDMDGKPLSLNITGTQYNLKKVAMAVALCLGSLPVFAQAELSAGFVFTSDNPLFTPDSVNGDTELSVKVPGSAFKLNSNIDAKIIDFKTIHVKDDVLTSGINAFDISNGVLHIGSETRRIERIVIDNEKKYNKTSFNLTSNASLYIYADYIESNANNFAASLWSGNCKLNFYVKNAVFQGENGFSAKNNSSINATIDEKLKIYVKHRGFLVQDSTLTLNAKDLEVVVMDPGKLSTGVIDNRGGAVTTITATNNINFRNNSDQKSALVIKNQGKLTLSANNVYIGSVVDNAISHTGSSLSISAKNSIRIDGDVFSTSTLNSSVVDINKDGKANVTIVGNVGTSNGTITTGNGPVSYPSNQLTLNLGKSGSLTGAVLDKKAPERISIPKVPTLSWVKVLRGM